MLQHKYGSQPIQNKVITLSLTNNHNMREYGDINLLINHWHIFFWQKNESKRERFLCEQCPLGGQIKSSLCDLPKNGTPKWLTLRGRCLIMSCDSLLAWYLVFVRDNINQILRVRGRCKEAIHLVMAKHKSTWVKMTSTAHYLKQTAYVNLTVFFSVVVLLAHFKFLFNL